jgi:regulatory protein
MSQHSGTARITAIEPARRKGRFSLFVDGAPAANVGERTLAELHLAVGQAFTPQRLFELAQAEEKRRAVESAARLLSTRPRSAAEITRYLKGRGYDDEVVTAASETLTRAGLLADDQFARDFVASRLRARPSGTFRLRAELAEKGVAREQIDEAVSAISLDDQADAAKRALAGFARKGVSGLNAQETAALKRRGAAFLQRRGFSWDVVRVALGELIGGDIDDDESTTDGED